MAIKTTKGDAFRFNVGYTDPVWWSTERYGTYDDKFEINDLGYLRRNDLTWAGVMFKARRQNQWGFLGASIELKYKKQWRGDGHLDDELTESWTLLKNYWRFGLSSKIKQPYNDDIFRDEGLDIYTEKFWWNGIWIKSDRRKVNSGDGIGNAKLRGRAIMLNLRQIISR